jgi:salicylate hydroxylase
VARWGAPFYHLHRADLHHALCEALGNEHITLAARCVSVDESNGAATIGFADGRTASGDMVIGADGVHSVVREYVAGPDRPTWARQVSWRGLAPAALGREIGLEMRHHSFWGPGKQFVAFYVSGGRLVNWVGNTLSDDEWQEESWSARGDRDELLTLYAGWHREVRALMAGTEHIFRWALFDRPPLSRWTRGHVTLLGDAAHPMLPYMAQGAGQSIEDGYVLARCMNDGRDDPAGALGRYGDRRRERTAAVQEASRQAARLVQLSDPDEVAARNHRLAGDPEAPIARFDWIWSHDVEQALAE